MKNNKLIVDILIFSIFIALLYQSGIAMRWFWGLLGLMVVAAPFCWHLLKQYQKDRLTVDSNREMMSFGIENTVLIGPKYNNEKVNGITVNSQSETTVEKDFGLVEPRRHVEIIYTNGINDLLIAKTVLLLD